MAASTRALTPTHSGPFGNSLDASTAGVNVKSLAPLSNSVLRRSPSPRSPKAMSPGASPSPATRPEAESRQLPATTVGQAAEATSIAKAAATKISTPLASALKTITVPENGTIPNAQTSPMSVSSLGSADPKYTPTVTAPSGATAVPASEDSTTGRPVVDPGLPGAAEVTPNRAFTYPPPLSDEHTPAGRNLSLPTNVFPGSSPKSGGSASKRHKCPYCSTEFTRHHNLKSHL